MAELSEIIVEQQISFTTSNIDSLLNSLKIRLDDTKFYRRQDAQPTIFRVSNTIRELEPDAYDPYVVALGPYHHGKPSLAKMEGLKLKCLKAFLMRNREKELEDYMMEVRQLERNARSTYSELLETNSDEFVEMMLLDCCFVLELLRIFYAENDEDRSSSELVEDIKSRREIWTLGRTFHDMLLAENQLPFFLLQSLCRLNDPSFDLCNIAVKLVISCDVLFYNYKTEHFFEIVKTRQDELHHFLHLMYILLKYDIQKKLDDASSIDTTSPSNMMKKILDCKNVSCMQSKYANNSCYMIVEKIEKLVAATFSLLKKEPSNLRTTENITVPNATKLKEAGVKFKKNRNPTSILDVTFHNGVMYIPQLHVFDDTSYILRNLIAFEQFFSYEDALVSSYVDFMDSLVDTAEDVAELQEDGIIVNAVGSNETIAILFNKMCKRVYLGRGDSYLRPVCLNVVKYANRRRNKWRAKLNRDYFNNPWSLISFLAAFLLLVLTLTQTIFAIVAYVKPPH